MRFVIQVVRQAAVTILPEEPETGSASPDAGDTRAIGKGLAVLIGVGCEDTVEIAGKMVDKLLGLRIFADENGKTNLSLADVNGALLLVSQFTLYADCRHGNRPGFTKAAPPDLAEQLFQYIIEACRARVPDVKTGEFGAYMQVSLVNDGPFTILLDSDEIIKKKS
ncbi:MAG: D-tyrosyl-tRNA(Tyr) deacylase [Lachnospiraceae bacterium]|nr:D-tyrosyl-tRNA(Tyr) deacylase [Lachnospiraceae bacterium]